MSLTRLELWKELGYAKPDRPRIDGIVESAYVRWEESEHRNGAGKSPHNRLWHTSFHASAFPGGVDERRCGRKALYELMNIPGELFTPRSRAIMEQGRATERQIVYRLGHAGKTLGGAVSLDPDRDGEQLHLVDPNHWLTGAPDIAMDLRPDWEHIVPVDVKSKALKGLLQLIKGERNPEPGYIAQVRAYGHLMFLAHGEMGWADMGLKPAKGGIIYYASRENPRDTWEHWVEHDQAYVDAGLTRLREWITLFKEGALPERDKRWPWSEEPCKWCPFKAVCKEDIKAGITLLNDSSAVLLAKERDLRYDPDTTRKVVVGSWKGETT